ncbi:class I SAM-dependent methyltransferase [Variovorax beijingensis]|uniref:Class I SAM-dependent methyltransferase n=1 Tax=Variovorax beijingensis TaxID=2496117 RepID=A0ABY0A917_9BURK|nr:class I SAM-dependent methyltransferase [Variovorax beijingensis]RSZ40029.1 class I SAM-dependent methyltransferase [Variovorax beijingensis]
MDITKQQDNEQAALWNGRGGRAWVDAQESLDQLFTPFENLLVDEARAASAHRVLDVGCGTGATTLAIAQVLGAAGHCVGADISEPMIAAARARAERACAPASFICGDVQRHAFEPASFDLIVSRFGVMFFDSPVQAFANLRHAAKDGTALRAIAWRSAADNPFMTTAERAAAPLLPNLPVRRPGAPGQFSFADRDRVVSILEESGWAGIDIRPIDVECTLPEKALHGYLTRLGPVGLVLQDADERTRAQVTEAMRAAFEPYVHGSEVRFTAACWMIGARAPFALDTHEEAARA